MPSTPAVKSGLAAPVEGNPARHNHFLDDLRLVRQLPTLGRAPEPGSQHLAFEGEFLGQSIEKAIEQFLL